MAKKLSSTENKSLNSLEQNMDARVLAYRKEKQQQFTDGKKHELASELETLEKYLLGCRNGEIADVLPNIQFAQRKKEVLKKLLS